MAGIHRTAIPAVISIMLIAISEFPARQPCVHSHCQVQGHDLPSVIQGPVDLYPIVESKGAGVECAKACVSFGPCCSKQGPRLAYRIPVAKTIRRPIFLRRGS